MALLDVIQKGASVQEVDNYLKTLAQKHSDKLPEELATPDSRGMTPLHHAVQKGDLELVKLLLGFDASVLAKKGNQTVEDYAKELANSQAETKSSKDPANVRKQIHALIKSRGRWQAQVSRADGISLPRSIKAIEEAMDKVRGAEGKTGVLFFGLTGQGKSTSINFLLGVDYQIKKEDGVKCAVPKGNSSEAARVGNTTTSETLFPQVLLPKQGSYVFVDLPGFEDTRGRAEEICAAASIFIITKQLRGIQGILFICAWDGLADPKMLQYRRSAGNVGAMIALDPRTSENVMLVVTKPEGGDTPTTVEDIRARLNFLSKNEHWDHDSTEREMKREDVTPEQWRKQCIRRTTKAILSRQNSIIIMDVTKPKARKEFDALVATLSKCVQPPDQFDFTNYSHHMEQFSLVIEQIIVFYNKLVGEKKIQEDKLHGITNSISEIKQEHENVTAQIEKYNQQKSEPFTAESFDQQIIAEREKLTDLRRKLRKYEAEIQEANFEYKARAMQVNGMECDGEKLIDTLHRGWMCEKTEDQVHRDLEEVGGPIDVMGPGGRPMRIQPVRPKVIKVPGIEKAVTGESVRYTSSVPIQRYVDRSTGGTFTVSSFSPGAMELSGSFTSTPGARGAVSLSVELYGNISDFPGTKIIKIRHQQQLESAKTRLEQVQSNAVSQEEVDHVSDNIRELQLQKMAAVGNKERTQLVCETQISLLQPKLEVLNKKLADLRSQTTEAEDELEDLSLQISVNHELFLKLHQIITIMGFRSDILTEFQQSFSDTPQPLPSSLKKSLPPREEKSSSADTSATIHTTSGSFTLLSTSSTAAGMRGDSRVGSSSNSSCSTSKSSFTSSSVGSAKEKAAILDERDPSDSEASDVPSELKEDESLKAEIQKYADKQNCYFFELKRKDNVLNIQITAKQHNEVGLKNVWGNLQLFLRKSMPDVPEKEIQFSDAPSGNGVKAKCSIIAAPIILHRVADLLKDCLPAKYMTPAVLQSPFFQASSGKSKSSAVKSTAEEKVICAMQ